MIQKPDKYVGFSFTGLFVENAQKLTQNTYTMNFQ